MNLQVGSLGFRRIQGSQNNLKCRLWWFERVLRSTGFWVSGLQGTGGTGLGFWVDVFLFTGWVMRGLQHLFNAFGVVLF